VRLQSQLDSKVINLIEPRLNIHLALVPNQYSKYLEGNIFYNNNNLYNNNYLILISILLGEDDYIDGDIMTHFLINTVKVELGQVLMSNRP
jgi:hypothetical protein